MTAWISLVVVVVVVVVVETVVLEIVVVVVEAPEASVEGLLLLPLSFAAMAGN